jgi:hypothetical protein
MGMIRKIYLDSCIAIYLVEEHPAYAAAIEDSLAVDVVRNCGLAV